MNPDSIRTVTHMEVNVSDQFMRQTRIEQFCAWAAEAAWAAERARALKECADLARSIIPNPESEK